MQARLAIRGRNEERRAISSWSTRLQSDRDRRLSLTSANLQHWRKGSESPKAVSRGIPQINRLGRSRDMEVVVRLRRRGARTMPRGASRDEKHPDSPAAEQTGHRGARLNWNQGVRLNSPGRSGRELREASQTAGRLSPGATRVSQ
jgi:hypothetical protein